MKISNEALITLAAEEAAFPAADDALDRLCFLTGPLFFTIEAGDRITGEIAAEIIERNFGLKIPAEVTEALIIRLAKHGYLGSESAGEANVFFANKNTDNSRGKSVVDALIKDFRKFIENKSLLTEINDDEIIDLFINEIFNISDLLSSKDYSISNPNIEKWKIGIVSEYVIENTDDDNSLTPLLSKLAELCLMKSIVDNMTSGRREIQKSNLVAFLDAPLALFSVGASGKFNKSAIESTLSLASKIGVRIAVLPISVAEIKRVLHATLSTDHRNRRGLTAAAIRRGDLIETVADDIRRNPEKYLKEVGITILPRNLETFPAEHKFYPEEMYVDFSVTASAWANTEAGEFHDAECLALTMRARKGQHSPMILANSHVFVSNNWKYVSAARRKCLSAHMINEAACPPVIHLNSFAAAVWLAGGFDRESKIPEKTLLAACERALSEVGGVLDKVERLFHQLKMTDDATIELLMRDRNSVQAMVSQSGGDPTLINEENIGTLLSITKEAVAKEVSDKAKSERIELLKRHEAEVVQVTTEFEKRIREKEAEGTEIEGRLKAQLADQESQNQDIISKYNEEKTVRQQSIERRVKSINSNIRRDGWGLVEWFETTFFGLASILMGFKLSLVYGIVASIIGLVFVTLSYFRISFPHRMKQWVIYRYAANQLKREFSDSEIQEWGLGITKESEIIKSKDGTKIK